VRFGAERARILPLRPAEQDVPRAAGAEQTHAEVHARHQGKRRHAILQRVAEHDGDIHRILRRDRVERGGVAGKKKVLGRHKMLERKRVHAQRDDRGDDRDPRAATQERHASPVSARRASAPRRLS